MTRIAMDSDLALVRTIILKGTRLGGSSSDGSMARKLQSHFAHQDSAHSGILYQVANFHLRGDNNLQLPSYVFTWRVLLSVSDTSSDNQAMSFLCVHSSSIACVHRFLGFVRRGNQRPNDSVNDRCGEQLASMIKLQLVDLKDLEWLVQSFTVYMKIVNASLSSICFG